MKLARFAAFFFLALASLFGQSARLKWLEGKLGSQPARVAAAAEAGDSKSKAETPSINEDGPSIVDHNNPTEFFNVALALASQRGTGGVTGTSTSTLYGILAAIQRKSLIDPDFYREQRYLRRISFTLGTAASDPAQDGTSTDAVVYGFRYRILDGTDLYAKRQGKPSIFDEARTHLLSNEDAALFVEMRELFMKHETEPDPAKRMQKWLSILSSVEGIESWFQSLSKSEQDTLNDRIRRVGSADAVLTGFLSDIRQQLQKPRQLSIAYFTNQRKDGGADDHRAELIFDYGFNNRLSWTVNGGLEYRNVYKHTGGDRRGGRFATELQYKLYNLDRSVSTVERWITFDFGGEWRALTGSKPMYKGQAKLTIPLVEGVSLPLVWSYQSQPEQGLTNPSSDLVNRGAFHFGITFDPGKLKSLVSTSSPS